MARKYITASDLYNYKICRMRPFLDFNGDPSKKVEIHPLIKLLWDAGVQYEAKVIESFKQDNPGKTFVEISPGSLATTELAESTRLAMKNGSDFIYQGVLIADGMLGRPDLLVREPGQSLFGDYRYYPLDIKLARIDDEWPSGDEKFQLEQIWQIYFYGKLLEQIQGTLPSGGYLFKTKSRQKQVNFTEIPYQYSEAISTIRGFVHGEQDDAEPAINSNCKQCEWFRHCVDWAEETQDISLLYWVGHAMKRGFQKLGIRSISDLLKQEPDNLLLEVRRLKAEGYFWKTMPESKVYDALRRAKIYRDQKPVIHETIEFPDSAYEIHFDVEDDPTQDFVYLHGIVLAEKGKAPIYHSFFAESPAEENRITEELFDFLKKYKGSPVYHYSSYEKTTLKRLISKYKSLDPTVYDMLFGENGTAIDLMKVIETRTDWPLTSYGLKSICKYLGFKWAAEDAGGAASIVWMNDYLKGNKALKNKILTYNENDCQATWFLKNKLLEIQKKPTGNYTGD